MPNELYLVRLVHYLTRRAFPGERVWTAEQLGTAATATSAGYILLDLDHARPTTIVTNARARA